jgi:hypothetical protein
MSEKVEHIGRIVIEFNSKGEVIKTTGEHIRRIWCTPGSWIDELVGGFYMNKEKALSDVKWYIDWYKDSLKEAEKE